MVFMDGSDTNLWTTMEKEMRCFYIEKRMVDRIRQIVKRLYSEEKFRNGDEMRDLAQYLDAVLDHLVEVEEDKL